MPVRRLVAREVGCPISHDGIFIQEEIETGYCESSSGNKVDQVAWTRSISVS